LPLPLCCWTRQIQDFEKPRPAHRAAALGVENISAPTLGPGGDSLDDFD
jgi:hypothetical protein